MRPPWSRPAIRAARRMSCSPGGAPVRATTTRSPLPPVSEALARRRGLTALLHPVRDPQEGQLPQGGQVAGPEVVGQRGVDLRGRVDVAVGHPASQRLRAHVDQLDLVGPAHDGVGHRLALAHSGDPLHDVVDALEVLDVDGRDHVDAGVEELVHVLPPLPVAAVGHVGVGQLVHERHRRVPGQHGVDVHLFERDAPVGEPLPGHQLQVVQLLLCLRPPVGLHEADDHVGAALLAPPALVEHGVGLADARGGAEVDPQLTTAAPGAASAIVTPHSETPVAPGVATRRRRPSRRCAPAPGRRRR